MSPKAPEMFITESCHWVKMKLANNIDVIPAICTIIIGKKECTLFAISNVHFLGGVEMSIQRTGKL